MQNTRCNFRRNIQGRQLLRLPVCFLAQEVPSEKGSTRKGKKNLPVGANSFFIVDHFSEGTKTILMDLSPLKVYHCSLMSKVNSLIRLSASAFTSGFSPIDLPKWVYVGMTRGENSVVLDNSNSEDINKCSVIWFVLTVWNIDWEAILDFFFVDFLNKLVYSGFKQSLHIADLELRSMFLFVDIIHLFISAVLFSWKRWLSNRWWWRLQFLLHRNAL